MRCSPFWLVFQPHLFIPPLTFEEATQAGMKSNQMLMHCEWHIE